MTLSTSRTAPLLAPGTAVPEDSTATGTAFPLEGAAFAAVVATASGSGAGTVAVTIEGSFDGAPSGAWFPLGTLVLGAAPDTATLDLGPKAFPPYIRAAAEATDDDATVGVLVSFGGETDGPSQIAANQAAIAALDSSLAGLVKIDEIVLAASAPALDFQNIPAEFSHLVLKGVIRTNHTDTFDAVGLQFNGDTTAANYNWQVTQAANTTASSQQGIGSITPLVACAANSAGNDFAVVNLEIPFANNSGIAKVMAFQNPLPAARTSGTLYVRNGVYHWKATPAAVNRIRLVPALGSNFVALSGLSLYGIRSAG